MRIELNGEPRELPAGATLADAVRESGVDGLLWAPGHYRNGILLAPLAAERLVELLEGVPA